MTHLCGQAARGQVYARRLQHPEGVIPPYSAAGYRDRGSRCGIGRCKCDNQFTGSTPPDRCQTSSKQFSQETRGFKQTHFFCYILYIEQWGFHCIMCQTITNDAPSSMLWAAAGLRSSTDFTEECVWCIMHMRLCYMLAKWHVRVSKQSCKQTNRLILEHRSTQKKNLDFF